MFDRILIANRGEIAVRVARAVADLGAESVAVYSSDDASSLHVTRSNQAVALPGHGARAYLDIEQVVGAAQEAGCDAVHPGYGFLSENSEFAQAVETAGMRFIGPNPKTLQVLGNKLGALDLALSCDVPTAGGSVEPVSLPEARTFMQRLGGGAAIMVKPVFGGGGRGIRVVAEEGDLEAAYARSGSEALAGFGSAELYVERYIARARHVEVQILGDGTDIVHLWDRECTLQRRHQKLVEVAPARGLPDSVRQQMLAASVRMARKAGVDSLVTFEFLVDVDAEADAQPFVFMEANPRLQVEHTVTEEVTGLDLVAAQIRVAAGESLIDQGLTQETIPAPRNTAVQVRINAESIDREGQAKPSVGTLTVFEPPIGPGIRVDTYGYGGYAMNPAFDSLLAKVIVCSRTDAIDVAMDRTSRALREFRIQGVDSNLHFSRALLGLPEVRANHPDTKLVERRVEELCNEAQVLADKEPAVQTVGGGSSQAQSAATEELLDTEAAVVAPMHGTVVALNVGVGHLVAAGQQVGVLEAMKMEHVVVAPEGGRILRLLAAVGDPLVEGAALAIYEPVHVDDAASTSVEEVDLDDIRSDLRALQERLHTGTDEGRPVPVAKRHKLGMRTARENIADLVDEDSFSEYGGLLLAAQRSRRSHEELMAASPADGLVCGTASINADKFASGRAAVFAYDWTVFGGTQGIMGHRKMDRLLKIAHEQELPTVIFAEGGGGRPGDTEFVGAAEMDTMTFQHFGRLNGRAPLVGITNRFCFAGNAALLSMCDVIIAAKGSNIGMGGPAMIEGGGMGKVPPTAIGGAEVQARNGVVDVLVENEEEAVAVAKKYLGFFQGNEEAWSVADQRLLRNSVPADRKRAYDVRALVETLADTDSVLELRREFGQGLVSALIRVEGRPIGVLANNPRHLGGALDADAADKGARFMQLCDAFGIPLLMLTDTPGFMVGPEAEETAQVRHIGRMFVNAANLEIPIFNMILRKGYGLGAAAMAGGGFHATNFTISWPTGEFGPMGIEGAVRLAYAKELAAVSDPREQAEMFDRLVAIMYEKGSAVSLAEFGELDAVIDPAESRQWISRGLRAVRPPDASAPRRAKRIDPW